MNVDEQFQDQNETYDENFTSSTNTSEAPPSDQLTWPELEISDKLWPIAGLLTIIVGSVSHVLSLSVLLGSKRMRLLSLTVYLAANSFAGLAVLYIGLLRQVILYLSDVDVRDLTSDFGCGLHAALTYMSLQLFSWLQATVAVERTVAVLRPLKYKRWCTWRRNIIVVIAVVLLLGMLNAIVGSSYHFNHVGQCAVAKDKKKLFENVWGYVDMVLFSLFPSAIIIPCNVLTLHTIYRSKMESRSSGQNKYIQLTIMLLVQNCVCVVTTLPISVLFLLPWPTDMNSPEYARRELEWTVISLLQYFGTTFGFFIYSTSARRFRRSILDLFFKGCNANIVSLSGLSSLRKQTKSIDRPAPAVTTQTISSPTSAETSLKIEVQRDKPVDFFHRP